MSAPDSDPDTPVGGKMEVDGFDALAVAVSLLDKLEAQIQPFAMPPSSTELANMSLERLEIARCVCSFHA